MAWSLRVLEARSAWFALVVVWLPLGWFALLGRILVPRRPVLRLPARVHALRAVERDGRVYELLGVRVAKRLRRGPLAVGAPDLHLPAEPTSASLAVLDAPGWAGGGRTAPGAWRRPPPAPATLPDGATWYLVTNLPRLGGPREPDSPHPAAGLAEIVRLYAIRNTFDEWARTHGHDAKVAPPERYPKGPAVARGQRGRQPGACALGLPVLRRRRSTFICGTEDDAREVVDHLARYLAIRR